MKNGKKALEEAFYIFLLCVGICMTLDSCTSTTDPKKPMVFLLSPGESVEIQTQDGRAFVVANDFYRIIHVSGFSITSDW